MSEEKETEEKKEEEGKSVLRSIARKLRKSGDSDDVGLLGSVLESGDKAKTEIVRMLAKEVRGYLEALELHKDLKHILTNYSLEVKASFHLKELIPEDTEEQKNNNSVEDTEKK